MTGHDQALNAAVILLELHRERAKALPTELFSESAWVLLLELFIADARGHRLTGDEVSRRCDIKPHILSPWLMALAKLDLIVGDGSGDLSDELTLSGTGMESMEKIMSHAILIPSVGSPR